MHIRVPASYASTWAYLLSKQAAQSGACYLSESCTKRTSQSYSSTCWRSTHMFIRHECAANTKMTAGVPLSQATDTIKWCTTVWMKPCSGIHQNGHSTLPAQKQQQACHSSKQHSTSCTSHTMKCCTHVLMKHWQATVSIKAGTVTLPAQKYGLACHSAKPSFMAALSCLLRIVQLRRGSFLPLRPCSSVTALPYTQMYGTIDLTVD